MGDLALYTAFAPHIRAIREAQGLGPSDPLLTDIQTGDTPEILTLKKINRVLQDAETINRDTKTHNLKWLHAHFWTHLLEIFPEPTTTEKGRPDVYSEKTYKVISEFKACIDALWLEDQNKADREKLNFVTGYRFIPWLDWSVQMMRTRLHESLQAGAQYHPDGYRELSPSPQIEAFLLRPTPRVLPTPQAFPYKALTSVVIPNTVLNVIHPEEDWRVRGHGRPLFLGSWAVSMTCLSVALLVGNKPPLSTGMAALGKAVFNAQGAGLGFFVVVSSFIVLRLLAEVLARVFEKIYKPLVQVNTVSIQTMEPLTSTPAIEMQALTPEAAPAPQIAPTPQVPPQPRSSLHLYKEKMKAWGREKKAGAAKSWHNTKEKFNRFSRHTRSEHPPTKDDDLREPLLTNSGSGNTSPWMK